MGPSVKEAVAKDSNTAETVAVMILSSNLANGATIGEWGFLHS